MGQMTVDDPRPEGRSEREWRKAIPRRFQDARIDNIHGDEVVKLARRWNLERNVMLLGSVGRGKTWAAVAMARKAHEAGKTVAFYPVVKMLDELRPDGDQIRVMRETTRKDVLVLDDLGIERPTEWSSMQVYRIVNDRYNDLLPTIVTSNLSPEGLRDAVGGAVWGRFYEDAMTLRMRGEDRRTA